MLSEIEQHGRPALRWYAKQLDGWTGGEDFEISQAMISAVTDELPTDLREAPDAGVERTHRFASMQRAHLHDFEDEASPAWSRPEVHPRHERGAYLSAGRFPLLASAFMTVGCGPGRPV